MKQLSGLDAAMLAAEDDRQFTHVSQLLVLQKPEPDFPTHRVWRERLARRLPRLAPLRRRLVPVPFELDHPYWVETGVDLDFHVRHSAIPAPGTDAQLDELVGRLVAAPLDRDRPLWLSHVIDGLAGDRFAILTMVHHAVLDGAAGADLLELMLDDDPAAGGEPAPDDPAAEERSDPAPDTPPDTVTILGRALWHGARRPGRALYLAARAGQHLARSSRHPAVIELADRVRAGLRGPLGDVLNLGRPRRPDGRRPRLPSLSAPPAPFNARISRYRRFAHRSLPLADVRRVGEAVDATINDVVVALCAGGLRHWLLDRGEPTDDPLTAMVPVSLRTGEEDDPWTNRVSGTVASLPTDLDDPLDRLRAAHDGLDVAKKLFRALPAALAPDAADLASPLTATAIGRATTWWITSGPTPFNLIVSNVPGPTAPLYLQRARQLHYVPVSAVADGQGLNITVQSYVDRLDIGMLACAELVPDLDGLADAVSTELDMLRAAVEDTGSVGSAGSAG